MDMEELAPEDQEEFEQKQKELIEDSRQAKQELEAEQNKALAEIAKGEKLEQFETVELGGLEMEVKAWIPGDTTNTVEKAMDLAQSDSVGKMKQSMQTMLKALADMTVSDTYDINFWRAYYQEYGPVGMQPAVNTILGPAGEELERLQQREVDEERLDAANGFRTDEQGRIIRSGNGDDGSNPE